MVVDDHEVGNSTVASLELISECDMTVSYPGECQWRCNGGGINNIFDGNIMQAVQDDAQAMVEVMNRNNITQEFGMPRDNNLLESHAGRVGGVPGARKCGVSGESGDRDITVQAVHSVVTDCTPVQARSYHTVAGDLTQEGWLLKYLEIGLCEVRALPLGVVGRT